MARWRFSGLLILHRLIDMHAKTDERRIVAIYMNAYVVPEYGGPDVYRRDSVPRPSPEAGQALIELRASGINYLDVVQRSGVTGKNTPFTAGVEGVGVIVEISSDESEFVVGQRVGWLTGGQGSFADYDVVDTSKLVAIPDWIDDSTAVAAMMQGITSHYLTVDTYPVSEDDVLLVHAASGGLGHVLTQMAKFRGATVLGTVSSTEKTEVAKRAGVDHILGYDGFAEAVMELTAGEGVSVVYDGVGATTFHSSLASLRPRGTLVCIGNASGPTPALDVEELKVGGSLYVTRPTVIDHVKTRQELASRALDVFSLIYEGHLKLTVNAEHSITDISRAFAALESRQTTGKIVLQH